MKILNQVILSIGSNLEDKLANIENCILLIQSTIGTVVKISRLYETESWGFDSDTFYNCALCLKTRLSPEEILIKIAEIEKKSGRKKKQNSGYEARIIDVDIIGFNDIILDTSKLKIPHPQMQNRLFVLLPMQDLALNYKHPFLNKTITQLIENCDDKNACTPILNLETPFENVFKTLKNIVIEGNIGAGKTTLVNKIAQDFNRKIILEQFADNLFLPKFYENKQQYAFTLEMSFLAERYKQINNDFTKLSSENETIIADYHIFKSLIFAKITLDKEEFNLYKNLFDIIFSSISKPDLYIFLYQKTENLLSNIKRRNRNFEQNIEPEYLEKINANYLEFIKSQPDLDTLIIDVSDKDFENNQEDYFYVLNEIYKKFKTNPK